MRGEDDRLERDSLIGTIGREGVTEIGGELEEQRRFEAKPWSELRSGSDRMRE